jgi:hypothetical protein
MRISFLPATLLSFYSFVPLKAFSGHNRGVPPIPETDTPGYSSC